MIRLHSIGAAAFALLTLALPTYALMHQPNKLTHFDTRGQLMDVNLAEVVTTAQAQGDGADGLPTTWCGDEITSDYPNTTTKPQFKVVYAFASDRPNRFAGWRDALQANVAIVQRFLSAQDGGTKALRIDMGTRCGPQYVDIQVVALPGPRAAFADNFGAISNAVRNAIGASASPRNTIILADGLAGGSQEYGLGESIMGSVRRAVRPQQHPQPRRADLGPVQPRRRRRAGRRPLGLVAGGLPARGVAQPRRGPVGRAALDAAARPVAAAVRPLLPGRRRHVLRRGRRRAQPDGHRLRGPPRRDPAELRLRPRRLLQPGPGGRLLPGDALEHVRLRVPGAVRRDRPGLRRREPVGPRAARGQRGPGGRRQPAPRLDDDRPRRHVEQRPDRLHVPVAAARGTPAGRTSRARRPAPTW